MKNILINYGKKLLDNGVINYKALNDNTVLELFLEHHVIPTELVDKFRKEWSENVGHIQFILEVYYLEDMNHATA